MNVLSLNLGSSSLKYAVHEAQGERMAQRFASSINVEPAADMATYAARDAIEAVTQRGIRIDAVGHRVVFGAEFDAPSFVTNDLVERLEHLQQLDPLHAPGALAVMREARSALQQAVHVACFDTAFFRDLPSTAKVLPIPAHGDPLLRRYGFHGLSYEYVVRALSAELQRCTIVAHLGSGSSVTALLNACPIDTTMGFSPLGGILMSTRPGDLDPGALLYLGLTQQSCHQPPLALVAAL